MTGKKAAKAQDLDKDAWIDAGLAAILEGGLAAVAVEPLARRLGVTKGSFYWHFEDRNALLGAMVDRWVKITDDLIAEVADAGAPAERLEALVVAAHRSPKGLRTLRAMSTLAGHAAVGERVRGVAERRQSFLAAALSAMGLAPGRAQAAAQVLHSATLGVGELEPLGLGFDTPELRQAYVDELVAYVRALAKGCKQRS
jgi:AcrR family transcriptional regulator